MMVDHDSGDIRAPRFWWEAVKGMILGAAIRLFLYETAGVPLLHWARELLLDVAILSLSFLTMLLIRLWRMRGVLNTLMDYHDKTEPNFRKQAIQFLRKNISDFSETIPSAFSKDGVVCPASELDYISALCFHLGAGVYHGTDSSTPSAFKKRYPHYLLYHESNLRKQQKPGVRVLLVNENDLVMDFQDSRSSFLAFYEWHLRNSITLLQVAPENATNIASNHSLPCTDIGIWDTNHAALFHSIATGPEHTVKLRIRTRSSHEFRRCQAYFLDIVNMANGLALDQSQTTLNIFARGSHETASDVSRISQQWTNSP